jgi:uncharacterized protein (DUF1810 family)
MRMSDPFHLQRFLDAQAGVFDAVLEELQAGRKRSHWMWFVFPQIEGLGYSSMAQKFAISGLKEAEAYIAHPTLGPRLRECTRLANLAAGHSIAEIFGPPDHLKFRSCMTLFLHATPHNEVFQEALDTYFGGQPDRMTLDRLGL